MDTNNTKTQKNKLWLTQNVGPYWDRTHNTQCNPKWRGNPDLLPLKKCCFNIYKYLHDTRTISNIKGLVWVYFKLTRGLWGRVWRSNWYALISSQIAKSVAVESNVMWNKLTLSAYIEVSFVQKNHAKLTLSIGLEQHLGDKFKNATAASLYCEGSVILCLLSVRCCPLTRYLYTKSIITSSQFRSMRVSMSARETMDSWKQLYAD